MACVPRRPTIFTGQYPDLHGVTRTDGISKRYDDSRLRWLRTGGATAVPERNCPWPYADRQPPGGESDGVVRRVLGRGLGCSPPYRRLECADQYARIGVLSMK
jgi:hypothetical protein